MPKKQATRKRRPAANKRGRSPSDRSAHTRRWSALTGLGLKNFKRFEKLSEFEIRPLTILTGRNSSGKSSILQSLVLLKQTFSAAGSKEDLILNDVVDLGSFDRVLCDTAPKSSEAFAITVQLNVSDVRDRIKEEFGYSTDRVMVTFDYGASRKRAGSSRSPVLREFRIELILEGGEIVEVLSLKPRRAQQKTWPSLPLFQISRASKPFQERLASDIKELPQGLIELDDVEHFVEFERSLPVFFLMKPKLGRSGRRSKGTPQETENTFLRIPVLAVSNLLHFVTDRCRITFSKRLAYVGPLREIPARLYPCAQKEIGPRGENALAFLHSNGTLNVENGTPAGGSGKLLHCVRQWLKHLNVAENLSLSPSGDMFFEVLVDDHYLPEVGCGVGQILPVIVKCLAAKAGDTVLLEQPEIHLHQSLQAELCDFLIAQMNRRIRIIVETHSEIMIQRLRRRIAEEPTPLLQEQVAVYFFGGANSGGERIGIDKDGNVDFWPSHFFDQGIQEMKAMASARSK